VHRPTVYRHFPTVEELLGACSGHWVALHPPPDPTSWVAVRDPDERLRLALDELFAYYEATEAMTRNVLRDAAVMPELAIYGDQFNDYFAAVTEVLLAGRAADAMLEAALTLATAFETWQTIGQRTALDRAGAIALAVAVVSGVTPTMNTTTPIVPKERRR
jgi:AcrR family transcriptional regulator